MRNSRERHDRCPLSNWSPGSIDYQWSQFADALVIIARKSSNRKWLIRANCYRSWPGLKKRKEKLGRSRIITGLDYQLVSFFHSSFLLAAFFSFSIRLHWRKIARTGYEGKVRSIVRRYESVISTISSRDEIIYEIEIKRTELCNSLLGEQEFFHQKIWSKNCKVQISKPMIEWNFMHIIPSI